MKHATRLAPTTVFVSLFTLSTAPIPAFSQRATTTSVPKPVIAEWVYRINYGYKDEWWSIFKKYQIAILERQKQLG